MKRLYVLYYFRKGDYNHLTSFFPLFKRCIIDKMRDHLTQQTSFYRLNYYPATKGQQD
jgi:hypothetical protein